MYKEIDVTEYSDIILKRMRPGNFLTTKKGDTINTMIIGWGGILVIWGRPLFIVLVRHCRATYDLIESSGEFTVSIPINNNLKKAINICGTKSLREIDKFEVAGLTPLKGRKIDTPIVGECELHYECKVLYKQKLDQNVVPNIVKDRYYNLTKENHTVYYGEILDQYLYEKDV